MMREIIFRGKRIYNGEWVIGTNICQLFNSREIWIGNSKGDWKVDPETVGQYTGLKDKKLNLIYEYDILDSDGIIIGNIHDNYGLQKERTNILIPQITSKNWVSSYKKAMERGCKHSK